MTTGLHKRSTGGLLTFVKWVCMIGFLPYIAYVLWLTLFSREPSVRRSMLTPFWEYRYLFSGNRQRYYFQQIFCNIAMLMPLGFMLPAMSSFFRKGMRTILLVFCSSVAIELTQWYTARGLMEFDDVFNNTVGGIFGYLLFWICFRRLLKRDEA